MVSFSFIHAADIHLDSPLRGLARYEGVPAATVRGASRAAFNNLIDLAIDERVSFIIIAGDLYDGDWPDFSTGLFFAAAMGRLHAARIDAYILYGNHDAASVITKRLPWPENVHVFSDKRPQTFRIDALEAALHGQGFQERETTVNLAAGYPAAIPGFFNIGVLHTSLTGREGHETYAPCTPAELASKDYDYWALGHVHAMEIQKSPYVVFPGNLQGRNVRETGPRGAMLVRIEDGIVDKLDHVPLDVVRWSHVVYNCAGEESIEAIHAGIREQLRGVTDQAHGRSSVVRIELIGTTSLSGILNDRRNVFIEELRAIAASLDAEIWLEKVVIGTVSPAAKPFTGEDEDNESVFTILDSAATDIAFRSKLAGDLTDFLNRLPEGVAHSPDSLLKAARSKDWQTLVAKTTESLKARLLAAKS
jgi:DNA repair protein SbcD/Mre11